MGCDIHLQVERRVNGKWTRVEKLPPRVCSWCGGKGHYEHRPKEDPCYWCKGSGADTRPFNDRNYEVFAILANVRNDGNVTPIADPRGLPEDCTHSGTGGREADYEYGDHSFSWLTLRELLAYDWKQECKDEGFVDQETFKKWDAAGAKGNPQSWSGGVGGRAVVHVSNADMRRRISTPYPFQADESAYTLIQWTYKVNDYAKHFLDFMEVIRTLGEPDDVRIVFGFDS